MNTHLIKPIIAVWLVLATSSLQAWQAGETAGGNTVELRKEQQSLEANVNRSADVANTNDGVRDKSRCP